MKQILTVLYIFNRWCAVGVPQTHFLFQPAREGEGDGVRCQWYECAPHATYISWVWLSVSRQQTKPLLQSMRLKYCRSQPQPHYWTQHRNWHISHAFYLQHLSHIQSSHSIADILCHSYIICIYVLTEDTYYPFLLPYYFKIPCMITDVTIW